MVHTLSPDLLLCCRNVKYKSRFIRQKRLSLAQSDLWHGCGVFVNAGAKGGQPVPFYPQSACSRMLAALLKVIELTGLSVDW